VISDRCIERRAFWVVELAKLSGSFGNDSAKVVEELRAEILRDGSEALLDHLRLCGAIPEQYGHDSSEEKLYSKYTDAVVSEAFCFMGLHSIVLDARGDSADVQARANAYSFVADAKAFRLSRTAKNQKDFKVQAMDGWRGGLDYAVIVGPIYQLPSRMSQVYQQAIARNVCIMSYAHLAALVGLAARQRPQLAEAALHEILRSIAMMHPSKSALDYWTGLNRALVHALSSYSDLWTLEKTISVESLEVVKRESLQHLISERDRLLGLSHQQALAELIRLVGVDSRVEQIRRIQHGPLLGV
jgi:type II restriction enzyme